MVRPIVLALAPAAVLGCTPEARVRGSIDGQQVSLQSGYFVQQADYDFGTAPTGTTTGQDPPPGDGLIYVVLMDVADACTTSFAVEEGLDAATSPADAAAAWAALPAEFWELTLVMRVDDPATDQDGRVLDGLRRGQQLDETDEAFGTFTRHRALYDEVFWSGDAPAEDYIAEWTTDGGELDVRRHAPGERIVGRFDTEAATLDGVEVGDLTIRFDVERCAGMEPFFFP